MAPLCEAADREGEFSMEVWKKLGSMGLLGLPFPEEYGGSGADFTTCCLAGEAMGHAGLDGGHTLALGAHTYLCGANIMEHGTEEQKKKYLPGIATGETIGCMGLTEPGSGSDAAALADDGVRRRRYILTGPRPSSPTRRRKGVRDLRDVDKSKKHKGSRRSSSRPEPRALDGESMHKMGCKCSTTRRSSGGLRGSARKNTVGGEGAGWRIAWAASSGTGASFCPFWGGGCSMIVKLRTLRPTSGALRQGHRRVPVDQITDCDMRVFLEAAKLAVYRVAPRWNNGVMLKLSGSLSTRCTWAKGVRDVLGAVDLFGGTGNHEYAWRGHAGCEVGQLGGGTSDIMRMIVAAS